MSTERKIGRAEASARIVAVVATASTGAAGVEFTRQLFDTLNNRTAIVETADDCNTRLRIKHQIFRDKGGPTFPDGKPRFQANTDEILGTAQNQRFLVEALGQSQVVTTNQDGEGFAQFRGRSDTRTNGADAIKYRTQNLQNGDSTDQIIPCSSQANLFEMTNEAAVNVQTINRSGRVETPPGTEVPRTPAPVTGTPVVTVTPRPSTPQPTVTVVLGKVEISGTVPVNITNNPLNVATEDRHWWVLPAAVLVGFGGLIGTLLYLDGGRLGRRRPVKSPKPTPKKEPAPKPEPKS